MDIGDAVALMKLGHRLRRPSWGRPSRGWYVFLQMPTKAARLDHPAFLKMWHDGTCTWAPTPDDLLATDWEEAD